MLEIFNGDCLMIMEGLPENSVDVIFCDLPYGITSCKWDCKIDLKLFWENIMRIKKINTPIFMTTTTKFGVDLIQSCPKNCPFRYDLVWVKSAPAGFLCAKKMPMRKHEMVYVFYEKLPFYDLSSHTHKFLNKEKVMDKDKKTLSVVTVGASGKEPEPEMRPTDKYKNESTMYGNIDRPDFKRKDGESMYDPPLPASCIYDQEHNSELYGNVKRDDRKNKIVYDPPLPVSCIYDNGTYKQEDNADELYREMGRKGNESAYDPPLPLSVVTVGASSKEDVYDATERFKNGKLTKNPRHLQKGDEPIYDPPLPTTMLEIKSTRGKHSTEKPIALMEWIFKYYSKEGDVILDPTMGSGSTGVACQNMGLDFIGIEMDPEIFDVAKERLKL